MPNYCRVCVEGGCYFFTVALANRKSHVLIDNIEYLRQAFREVMKSHPFKIEAAVILPEHLHCILPMMIIILCVGDKLNRHFLVNYHQLSNAL